MRLISYFILYGLVIDRQNSRQANLERQRGEKRKEEKRGKERKEERRENRKEEKRGQKRKEERRGKKRSQRIAENLDERRSETLKSRVDGKSQ